MAKIFVISGPTASGKSELALQIAELSAAKGKEAVIINADSLQIYQGLPILSSQPSAQDFLRASHLLYSHFGPKEYSSVGSWLQLVKETVEEIEKAGKLPIIVGGSGMYISKLIEGISEIPEIDADIRANSRKLFEEIGFVDMQQKLIEMGGDEMTDAQRLMRAYEVLDQTGKSISWWQDQPLKKILPEAEFVHVNLNPDREILYNRCNERFEKMLELGAFEEVKALIQDNIQDEKQVTKTLGFYEMRDFLEGTMTREKMIEKATQKTRNYAKRQLTWFRNQLRDKYVFSSAKAALNFCKDEI